MHNTLMHRSVLQPISWECAGTGGHFGCPFYSEKSLSTFIHMVLLQKVAQDLLDLNGKFACTKCEMLSSVPQHYKSRWRLRALAWCLPQWHQELGSSAFLPSWSLLLLLSFHLLQWHTVAATLLEVTQVARDCCFLSTFIFRMKLPKEPPKTCLIPHHWL